VSARSDDGFYVEDETPEELERSLAAAKRVLVIPSGLRRDIDRPWRLLPWMTTRIFRERWRRLRGALARDDER
jgi:hypothetical protein